MSYKANGNRTDVVTPTLFFLLASTREATEKNESVCLA